MAALSPTVNIYKVPHGKLFLSVVTVEVTSSGGHVPKASLGFYEAIACIGASCSTSAVVPVVFLNSQNGSDANTPGDVWLDSAGTSTYTVALLGR